MRTYIDDLIEEMKTRGVDMPNPYTPGAGTKPSFLAGRDDIIKEVTEYIDEMLEGGCSRHTIFYGVRGVGKTVLLNKMEEIASDRGIYNYHIECGEHTSLIEKLLLNSQKILRSLKISEKLKSKLKEIISYFTASYNFSDNTFSFSVNSNANSVVDLSQDLTDLFVTLGEAVRESGDSVIFFIDEIQSAENRQLSAMIAAVHRINQLNLPLLIIGAGLPTITRITGEAKSYSERLFHFIEISYLSEKNAISAIVEPALEYGVSYSDKALKKVINHTGCYPYFIQEFGYCLWGRLKEDKRFSEADVDSCYEEYIDKLDGSFYGARYNRSTKKEKEFLNAMLRCKKTPCSTAEIAKIMGKTQSSISPLRNHLINKGLIYSPSQGEVDFTVPHFDRYLKRLLNY